MTGAANEDDKHKAVARRLAQSLDGDEQARYRAWIEQLVAIRASNLSTFTKASQALRLTVSSGIGISIARRIASELARVGWSERGLKWRVGFVAAVVTAVATGGQGAGIAALGGAIGLPLWLVVGAGGVFLAAMYEELETMTGASTTKPPAASNSGGDDPSRDEQSIIDVDAKQIEIHAEAPSDPSALSRGQAAEVKAQEAHRQNLWVGDLDGRYLVFDRSIQITGAPHVFLWDSHRRQMEKFVPEIVRTLIRPCKDPSVIDELAGKYSAWYGARGESWLAEELPYYRDRTIKEAKRSSSEPAPRMVTHCYQCKEPLGKVPEDRCPSCGWTVCPDCSACGCGYKG